MVAFVLKNWNLQSEQNKQHKHDKLTKHQPIYYGQFIKECIF